MCFINDIRQVVSCYKNKIIDCYNMYIFCFIKFIIHKHPPFVRPVVATRKIFFLKIKNHNQLNDYDFKLMYIILMYKKTAH